MSTSIFTSFLQPLETSFSTFLDQVIEKKEEWSTKEDLMDLFRSVQSGKPVKRRDSKVKEEDDKCTFIITRGDKMGEKCNSRSKPGTSFCVKHYKTPKDEDEKDSLKIDVKEVKRDDVKEVKREPKTFSLEMKFKKDNEKEPKKLEIEEKGMIRLVKSTSVVINASNEIIGYMKQDTLIHGSSKEVDKVAKDYRLSFNKSEWKEDHIDE